MAGFGVFTILFGISRGLIGSLIALFLVGASDMVSVIIRATLVQIATPDDMRGRVNASDMLFIGVSNELGEFESGLTAHLFGSVPAVVVGGIWHADRDWSLGVVVPGIAERGPAHGCRTGPGVS